MLDYKLYIIKSFIINFLKNLKIIKKSFQVEKEIGILFITINNGTWDNFALVYTYIVHTY